MDKTTTVNLSDGRVATIHEGKGKHSREAMMETDGDGSKYLLCFMAKLVDIDGKKTIPEELDELPAKDYNTLQAEFAKINF